LLWSNPILNYYSTLQIHIFVKTRKKVKDRKLNEKQIIIVNVHLDHVWNNNSSSSGQDVVFNNIIDFHYTVDMVFIIIKVRFLP